MTDADVAWRLSPALALVWYDEGLVVDGAPRRHRFGGAAAHSLMPRLLPLLDGTRTPATISQELDVEPVHVDTVIRQLQARGLMERVRLDEPQAPPSTDAAAYLSRSLPAVGAYANAGELTQALARASVILVGKRELRQWCAEDLREVGCGGTVECSSAREVVELFEPTRQAPDLVVVFDCGDSDDLVSDTVSHCAVQNVPVLRVAHDDRYVEIGPLFCRCMVCVACFRAAQADLAPEAAASSDAVVEQSRSLVTAPIAASLATAEVIAVLTKLTPPHAAATVLRTDTLHHTTNRYELVPAAECGICTAVPFQPASHSIEAYEWQKARKCHRADDGATASQLQRIVRLQTERTPMPTSPTRALPDARARWLDDARAGPETGARDLDVDALSNVLARVAGLRPARAVSDQGGSPGLHRFAPSGGNLASVELYLSTDRSDIGFDDVLTKYDDIGHRLVAVRARPTPVSELIRSTDLSDTNPDVVIVFVAAMQRLAVKYADFSLRLAHLDAGCAALQLSLIATSAGFDVAFASRWEPELADMLELGPASQLVTAVASIRGATPAKRRP